MIVCKHNGDIAVILRHNDLIRQKLPLIFNIRVKIFIYATEPFAVIIVIIDCNFKVRLIAFGILNPVQRSGKGIAPCTVGKNIALFAGNI